VTKVVIDENMVNGDAKPLLIHTEPARVSGSD
jgi:hypothetical protein